MQLKALEIYGFKSFADRQKFAFDHGITGIVGPNGCGKSNIVDAIRWVLGEQRTKNLRSDKMENVIFNGTQHRRKASYAEVSLTFENTKNLLPTEYTSVAITRKLYRSGESVYMINGVSCRLKDIQNLFLDTGIRSDSYAIIELKMVDEMLNDKNNERRRFFEEAAGISKYKTRKKQTLKRLKATDDDLDRVEDVLFEIEKNLKSLERQAKRTKRYFEIKAEYKLVSSRYAFLKMRGMKAEEERIQKQEQQLKDELNGVHAEMAKREARVQELKKRLIDEEQRLSVAQRILNQHIQKIRQVETEKSIKNERLRYLQSQSENTQKQLEQAEVQATHDQSVLRQLREQFAKVEIEQKTQAQLTESLKTKVDQLRKQHEEEQQILRSLEAQQKGIEQELQSNIRDRDLKSVQVKSLEKELKRVEEDRSQRELDMDAFTEKTDSLEAEIEQLEAEVNQLQAKQEAHEREIEETEQNVNDGKDAVYKVNRSLDARRNEFNLTKSLVEKLEGFPESVKFLKRKAKWMKDAPLLSDVFACPEPYQVAIENYLESYLSYYVVQNHAEALDSIKLLSQSSKGRANFFILNELQSYQSPKISHSSEQLIPALSVVEYAAIYQPLAEYLLGNVYFVEQQENVPEDLPEGMIVLTRNGTLARRKFVLSGGSLGLFEGKRLGRAKNLKKLEKEVKELEQKRDEAKSILDQNTEKLQSLRKINFKQELKPKNKELIEKQRDISVLQSREKEYREFMARVGRRKEQLEAELDKLSSSIRQLEPQIKFHQEELQQVKGKFALQEGKTYQIGEQLSQESQAYNQENIKHIRLQNQYENLQRDIDQKERALEQYEERKAEREQELNKLKLDIEHLVRSNTNDDEQVVALYEEREQKEAQLGELEQQVGQTKSGIFQGEEMITEIRRERENVQERQRQLQDLKTEVRIELTALKDRMSVEFQIELDDLSEAVVFEDGIEGFHVEELEPKLHKVRNRVQNFGEINPMAVEAYDEMKERYDFIQSQRQDLLEAKESLLKTIAEIDQTAKEKFIETFDVVRANFQQVFRTLFSQDDKCDVMLLEPDNPLESTIDIKAQPKGKRPLTINQLSGGEKTLTAVALLFAIYLHKPAPFCIFDEVDAPLDDANIDKFNNIIREFSEDSQFLIVTHNKRTMASTNVMYGVTMPIEGDQQGVSRVLPVDFNAIP